MEGFIIKPIIIITPHHENDENKFSSRFAYSDAVINSLGIPLTCALNTDKAYIDALLSLADGLLLSGGDDVATELYGEVRTEKCGPVSELRDEFEISLIKAAVSKNIPTLGICRGIQVMNVALGGTLYEDMPHHKQSAPNFMPSHKVDISGMLEGIYPKEANVNSFHHQAVKKVAPGLEICAISYDGYIEGIYKKNHRFFAGVQWHPEHMIKNDISAKKLFEKFVNECAKYRKERKNDKGDCT